MAMLRVALVVARLFELYQLLVVVACILTWIPRRPGSLVDDIAAAIGRLTEPWLAIFRRFIPPLGGIDFSPVVAILALQLIERLLLAILV